MSHASNNKKSDGWGTEWSQLNKRRYYGAMISSSLCVRLVMYPVTVAKTRIQFGGTTHHHHHPSSSSDTATGSRTSATTTTGGATATTSRQVSAAAPLSHQQLQRPAAAATATTTTATPQRRGTSSSGVLRTVARMVREDGVRRVYSGFAFSACTGLVGGPLYLTVLERSRAAYVDSVGLPGAVANSCAAVTGTLVGQLLMVPTDNVTQRVMVHRRGAASTAAAASSSSSAAAAAVSKPSPSLPASPLVEARDLFRADGVRGFYRGLGVSCLTYGFNGAMFWGLYPAGRRVWATYMPDGNGDSGDGGGGALAVASRLASAPCCAMVAGATALFITTPCDVVKTRSQLHRTSVRHTVRDLLATEGRRGFMLGWRMRVSNGAIMYSMFMSAYDFVKWYSRIDGPAARTMPVSDSAVCDAEANSTTCP